MNKNINIGDTLYRSKLFVQHVGLLVQEDRVLHNSPDGNIQLSSIQEYSNGKTVKVVSNDLDPIEQLKLFNKAEQMLLQAKQYGVISFNCEHLVSLMQSGKPSSEQLKGAGVGAVAGLLLANRNQSKSSLTYALVGGIIGCMAVNAARKYDSVL
ncbi:lecithin retinol acyltransferase family protein [Vibrio sp. SBT000027]|uniref:lecithin retinol acyltransferase family protein n=1 Tax=Vibrio sp. SBT000027 TaxID=1803384 RepID=UPI000EF4B55D|nr:hypothetical protein [Vibrio sp. SBT000027]RLQ16885.1 hypothetical protein AYK60_17365 [Vibrio sp. SBT000027]